VQCYYKSSKYIFLSLVNASSVSVKRIIAGHALISFLSCDKYIEQSSSIAFAIYNIARAIRATMKEHAPIVYGKYTKGMSAHEDSHTEIEQTGSRFYTRMWLR